VIVSDIVEFSVDFYINPSIPVNHTFFCLLHSFPKADVTWRYTARPDLLTPSNVSLPCNNGKYICDEARKNGTDEYYYNITIVGVAFEDSGIYTCVPQNNAFRMDLPAVLEGEINAHSFRIRVKRKWFVSCMSLT